MIKRVLVIDPAFLIWCEDDYFARQHDYWQMLDDFVYLTEALGRLPCGVAFSSALADLVVDSFPAHQLKGAGELHDFVRLIYAFLAKLQDSARNYECMDAMDFSPKFFQRPQFGPNVAQELRNCVAHAMLSNDDGYLATHSVVWKFSDSVVSSADFPDRTLLVHSSRLAFERFEAEFSRIFQSHDKHHPRSGYGSRLPVGLADDEIQSALNVALEVKGVDVLCARLEKHGAILLFRRHHLNKYHAYPIELNELTHLGVKFDLVPVCG